MTDGVTDVILRFAHSRESEAVESYASTIQPPRPTPSARDASRVGLGIFKLHRRAKPFEVPSGSLVSLWRRRALPSTVTRALTFSFLPKLSPQQVVVLADAAAR